MTPDGIKTEDWNRVHELALAIVNASDDEEKQHRTALLSYIADLISVYGERPSLLATKADYVEEPLETERLLRRAFEIASATHDVKNALWAALSLAEFYAAEMHSRDAALQWLAVARDRLHLGDDSDGEIYRRVEHALSSLKSPGS